MFDTNVRGPFLLARAATAHMRKAGSGRIVNIASVAGLLPTGSSLAYASSKSALIHLTRCLAVALAPEITVNCVAPGLVEGTRMANRIPPEVTEHLRKSVVLGRAAEAGDIAEQVVTFCRTDTITGQVMVVDGGFCFH
jgi:3-oxoacyl-[acyl-carrier protein] reductase